MSVFILLNDYGGYAFPLELSLELTERGYKVLHVYTSASGSPTAAFPPDRPNFTSIDIDIPPVQKGHFIQRWKSEKLYGERVATMIRQRRPDIILSANTPLQAQKHLQRACRDVKGRFIYWLQDLLGIAAKSVLSKKLGFLGIVVGLYFLRLEKKMLSRSDAIIVIAEAFAAILQNWRITNNNLHIIPNWAPIDSIPVLGKANAFSLEHGLADKFVVLYSGTMGMKQNPEIVVRAATALLPFPWIVFVFISNGVGMEYLHKQKVEKHLDNMLLLPLQPFEQLPNCLATADLGLVLLDVDAGVYCVPSKVWSLYCAARPVLLVVPRNNLAAQVTQTFDTGVVLEPDESEKLAQTILSLHEQPERCRLMGHNGRAFAEQYFQIDTITNQFEMIIQDCLSVHHSEGDKNAA
ncbi:glycosyltransferase WbuB [candidate division KSB1 bacterium]|nr:glycosyltransferase family 4 protein [candidate division KSB1 bacterium]RQW05727.1 MAG: glycosyltransferase WbuB [candidate division KSB1 bacterium]